MGAILYIISGLALIFTLRKLVAYANYRSSMHAYLTGYESASKLTWIQLEEQFSTFLAPFPRPIDAAAFIRGVTFFANGADDEHSEYGVKRDFNIAWKSGVITDEGTKILRLGYDQSAKLLSRGLHSEFIKIIHANRNEFFIVCLKEFISSKQKASV